MNINYWTPEFLRKLAENPITYADELAKIAFNLANAIESSMEYVSMQEAAQPSNKSEDSNG